MKDINKPKNTGFDHFLNHLVNLLKRFLSILYINIDEFKNINRSNLFKLHINVTIIFSIFSLLSVLPMLLMNIIETYEFYFMFNFLSISILLNFGVIYYCVQLKKKIINNDKSFITLQIYLILYQLLTFNIILAGFGIYSLMNDKFMSENTLPEWIVNFKKKVLKV